MACGCGQQPAGHPAPASKKLISEEKITKDNEVEVIQKFEDGTEKRFVVKQRILRKPRKLL